MSFGLAFRSDEPDPGGDNMAILASHLGTVFNLEAHRDGADWVALAYFSTLSEEDREEAGLGHLRPPKRKRIRGGKARTGVSTDAERNYRLTEGPRSRELSDDFLEQVGRAYWAALARGERPNKTMAADLGWVDLRTVERWVSKARALGFLGPARKGAAG